jgi:hypothetical protein
MSFKKFALVPYTDYLLMTDHKCVKNESVTVPTNHTLTHDVRHVGKEHAHSTPDKSQHVSPPTVVPELSEDVPVLNSERYKSTIQGTKRVIKNKTLSKTGGIHKRSKPTNTKRKKVDTHSKKGGKFTWLGV